MHATDSHRVSHQFVSRFRARRAFSLTELMVVIAIIVLLIGLLLVALAAVKKKTQRTETEATMTQFANACASFWAEHGQYPGVIPDAVLAASATQPPEISSTENALLHLMGGYRLLTPTDSPTSFAAQDYAAFGATANPPYEEITIDGGVQHGVWKLKIKSSTSDGATVAVLGDGPVINGKPYAAYFTPSANALKVVSGQVGEGDIKIPDLIDSWGQPIIYLRQSRDRGPIVRDTTANAPAPQFELAGVASYINSNGLGEVAANQLATPSGSVLTIGGQWQGNDQLQLSAVSAMLAHPAFYKVPPPATAPLYGKARGAVVLISAGPDGIFFSAVDGPGSVGNPLDGGNLGAQLVNAGPKVIEEFDDIRVFQGG